MKLQSAIKANYFVWNNENLVIGYEIHIYFIFTLMTSTFAFVNDLIVNNYGREIIKSNFTIDLMV